MVAVKRSAAVLLLVVWGAGSAAAVAPWDVAPVDPLGATPPAVCPLGGNGITPADALVVLRVAIGLISGFSCGGGSIPLSRIDVAPPGNIDATTFPPTVTVGGDGLITAADALLVLRAAVGLITLVSPGPDLHFDTSGGIQTDPLPILASDVDRDPVGNFPGPEDQDEGNGVLDQRTATLIATVEAIGPVPAVSLCAFDVDPAVTPGASALACTPLAPFPNDERRPVSLVVAAPSQTGTIPFWLVVDADQSAAETNEANNSITASLRVVPPPPPQPDLGFRPLTPLSLSPRVPRFGDQVVITTHLRNRGTGPVTQDFSVDLFTDPALPPGSQCSPVFFVVSGGIAAGAERSVDFSVGLGALAAGPHRLWALADTGVQVCTAPDGDVVEINEANNLSLPPLDFCVASGVPGPTDAVDLRAEPIDVTLGGDGTFRVRGLVSNAGTRDLLPFEAGLPQPPAVTHLSVQVSGAQQPAETEVEQDCLVVGATAELGFFQSFPLLPTPARVELRIDPTNEIPEADELNNNRCVLVQEDGTLTPC